MFYLINIFNPWLAAQPKLTSCMNRCSVGEKPESRLSCASYTNHGSARLPASLGAGEDAARGQGERAGYHILGIARNTGMAEGLSRFSISSTQLRYFCHRQIKVVKVSELGAPEIYFLKTGETLTGGD